MRDVFAARATIRHSITARIPQKSQKLTQRGAIWRNVFTSAASTAVENTGISRNVTQCVEHGRAEIFFLTTVAEENLCKKITLESTRSSSSFSSFLFFSLSFSF